MSEVFLPIDHKQPLFLQETSNRLSQQCRIRNNFFGRQFQEVQHTRGTYVDGVQGTLGLLCQREPSAT